MCEKTKKVRRGYYLKTSTIDIVKMMSEKHGISQNQIIERALKKEIKSLQELEPII